jgi:hypothetical protein
LEEAILFGLLELIERDAFLTTPTTATMSELYGEDGRGAGAHADLLADLRCCQDELVRAGADVIVVDQSTLPRLRTASGGREGARRISPMPRSDECRTRSHEPPLSARPRLDGPARARQA